MLNFVAGFTRIFLGSASWIGWLPAKRRTNYFRGGVHAELMIMGSGLIVLSFAGLYHLRALGLLGLAIVVAGFVLGAVMPAWLVPRWYKERYPDAPV
jgi:hypothetical protein